ncbi:MAG: PAS-domain containing protein [Deltaproteobacteria bacterium]|nr:PAS-domain containing protein [Deltaproteobacteria bacterium]
MTEHALLRRLLRKAGATPDEAPPLAAWQQFVALVGRTYVDADQDRYTLERSIEISSREMQGLYEELKRRSESELATERARVLEGYAIVRATLEVASEGIIVVDDERRVLAVNDRFAEVCRVPREVLASRDHAAVVAAAIEALGFGASMSATVDDVHASSATVRMEHQTSDGRTLEGYSTPVALPDGRRVGRVWFIRDITIERDARRDIEQARATAEGASHAKSVFLANMSHELRTPLNAVIGLSDLLLLDNPASLSARQREYIAGIAQSGRHLLALVNDVLDLAKIEAGRQELDLDDVPVGAAIEDGVAALALVAEVRGVAVAADAAALDATATVRADRLRLRQILYNLVSNAVKFTERGGSVRVVARCEERTVAIDVIDTGIGIAEDDLPRLCKAFEQAALPTGDRPPGTGLGLTLTKRLVEMHGGTLSIASQLGVGSTFTVRMPR